MKRGWGGGGQCRRGEIKGSSHKKKNSAQKCVCIPPWNWSVFPANGVANEPRGLKPAASARVCEAHLLQNAPIVPPTLTLTPNPGGYPHTLAAWGRVVHKFTTFERFDVAVFFSFFKIFFF